MDIQAVRQKKREAEEQITAIIKEFEIETGLLVTGIVKECHSLCRVEDILVSTLRTIQLTVSL